MTTIERMALALWQADALRELGPPVYDDIPDNLRETYLGYAKTALAALLPLDDGAVEKARWAFINFNGTFTDAGPDPINCEGQTDIAAAITAYLKHIGGETQT